MWVLVSGTRSLSFSSFVGKFGCILFAGRCARATQASEWLPCGREGKQASSRELPSSQLSPAQLRFHTVSYSANAGGLEGLRSWRDVVGLKPRQRRTQPASSCDAALPVIFEQVVTEAWPHRAREDKTDTAHVAFPSPTQR